MPPGPGIVRGGKRSFRGYSYIDTRQVFYLFKKKSSSKENGFLNKEGQQAKLPFSSCILEEEETNSFIYFLNDSTPFPVQNFFKDFF
ncbi:Hypothetical protein Minf_2091 [Methylacidiphilum infernorum V4]|uniref:Uncharacterized protein n=1 Tax=Methylacidiphilum infernorum (isolate V4) TaxID=481448 RepID=B3DZ53_METI4|nr:Hypothetical protein Minf_2091 [Methylacidiphilum infernorum V4]